MSQLRGIALDAAIQMLSSGELEKQMEAELAAVGDSFGSSPGSPASTPLG